MEIKAAVLREVGLPAPYAQSKPLAIEKVTLDAPGPNEVLVKIKAAGLCHSDLSVINGDRPRGVPIVLGHEASAEVVQLGENVHELSVGDHVVLVFVPACGSCESCISARPALCGPGAESNTNGTLLSGERRLSLEGEALNHHTGISCFAEYAVVSVQSCVKVTVPLSHREAALFGCAVLTGAGAVLNRARIRAGDSVAIVGLGGVGLSALLAAVAAGAERVVAVDLDDNKLELAKTLGATHVINPTHADSLDEQLAAAGGAVHYAFDMAGSVPAFEMAYKLTAKGGATVTSSLPNPKSSFALTVSQLVAEERSVLGSYLGSGVPKLDINRYINLYKAGKLPVDKLMGQVFKLEEVNEGFDRMLSGSNLRDVILFD